MIHREATHGAVMWACPKCPYVNDDDKVVVRNVHGKKFHRGVNITSDIYECTLLMTSDTVCKSKPTMPSITAPRTKSEVHDVAGQKDVRSDSTRKYGDSRASGSKDSGRRGDRDSVGGDERKDKSTYGARDSAGSLGYGDYGGRHRDGRSGYSGSSSRGRDGDHYNDRNMGRHGSRDKSTPNEKDSAGSKGHDRRSDKDSASRKGRERSGSGRRSSERDRHSKDASGRHVDRNTTDYKQKSASDTRSSGKADDKSTTKSTYKDSGHYKNSSTSSSSKRAHCTDLKVSHSKFGSGKSEKSVSNTVPSHEARNTSASKSKEDVKDTQQEKATHTPMKPREFDLFPVPPRKVARSEESMEMPGTSGQGSYVHPIGEISSSDSSSDSDDSLGGDPDVQIEPVEHVQQDSSGAPGEQQEPEHGGKVLAAENRVRIIYPDGREVIHSSQEWLPAERFQERQLPVSATLTCPLIPPSAPSQAQVTRLHEWLGGAIYYPPPKRQRAAAKKTTEAGDA